MMICKADFEELFPHIFRTDPEPNANQLAKPPTAACIARWDDDGGRTLTARSGGPRRDLEHAFGP